MTKLVYIKCQILDFANELELNINDYQADKIAKFIYKYAQLSQVDGVYLMRDSEIKKLILCCYETFKN